MFAELDTLQKADLLGYLLEDVTITGTELRIALRGEPAQVISMFTGPTFS